MIEAEVSFYDLSKLIELIEKLVKHIIRGVLQSSSRELQFFEEIRREMVVPKLQSLLARKFEIISYTECLGILNKNLSYSSPGGFSWGSAFSPEQEKYITTYFGSPVFVRDYPRELKAFYMKENYDKKTVACVDLLFPFIGEVVGGSSREENYEKLLQRAKLQGLDTGKLAWYFDLRKNGYSASAGFGLGLERLLMFITGSENIRDTIPFPRTAGKLQF